MGDSRRPGKQMLSDVVALIDGKLFGQTDDFEVTGLAALDRATPGDISFLTNPKYSNLLETTCAGAVLISGKEPAHDYSGIPLIYVKDAYLALARLLQAYHPPVLIPEGIADTARIHHSANLGKNVRVGENAVVSDGATVGDNCTIFPNVFIGKDVRIGNECTLYSNTSIYHQVIIGDRVIIHSGAVIGSDGFGFAKEGPKYIKMPQIGSVQIDDDVEIGANCTIDRGSMGMTVIERGVKLDNLIHLAHNVRVGEDTAIAAQTGISGSTTIGKRNMIGGQVGLAGHISTGDDVILTAKAGIIKSVKSSQMMSGFPPASHREWRTNQAALRHGAEMRQELKKLKKQVADLMEQMDKQSKD